MIRESMVRTSIMPGFALRTRSVRSADQLSPPAFWLCAALSACGLTAWAGEGPAVGAQQRTEARGWLQLESDQRVFRDEVGPLAPADAAGLDHLEQRQDIQLRGLQLKQRRELQTERRMDKIPGNERPVRIPPEVRNERGQSRERLDMRIQREVLRGAGR
jgi:hypothetical protein